METSISSAIRFKTNIKCGGCIAAVTPYLNAIEQLDGWNVDTGSPNKILTVQTTETGIGKEVQKAVEQAGYRAELLAQP
jgi:copper chaperone